MEFRKIKFNGEKVELTWTTSAGGLDVIVHTLSSFDLPEPEFRTAFDALRPHVLQLLDLPEDYGEETTIIGVSLSRSDMQGLGVVVTSQKKVSGAQAPFVFNTPYAVEESERGPVLPHEFVEAIEELEARAARYVQGHRAQGDLFDESQDAA